LRRFVAKMSGLSRAQVTRLIGKYGDSGEVKEALYRRHRFACRYRRADIELLAEVDEAHETLSGPATQKLRQRARYDFKDPRYERLAAISMAHIYNLRQSRTDDRATCGWTRCTRGIWEA
jgi:hypothetical protein